MKKPTLQTLAAKLNVSRQTVSNVINAPHKVKPETRLKVQRAIDESGYRPSVVARALRSQRSMQIGLRLRESGDGINGTVMDSFLHALVADAAKRGYRISLFTADSAQDELAQLQDLYESRAIDGCLLTDTVADDPRPEELLASGIPFVAFGRPWGDENAKHSWVDVDGREGTRIATQHLIDKGHTKIGFLGWPDQAGIGVERRQGWLDAAGLDDESAQQLQYLCSDSVANGAIGTKQLLEQGLDAIVCASDSLAIGALTEITVEESSAAVVGFDDTPVARAIGLTSLRQPMEAAAKAVLSTLFAHIDDHDAPAVRSLLAPELQIRAVADFL